MGGAGRGPDTDLSSFSLTRGQIAALALGAVLVFWMLGAYNRLVALRTAIGQAWATVDEALRQRSDCIQPLLAALREPLAAEHGALDTLQAAHADAQRCAAAMAARPVLQDNAAAWVAAEAALAAAGSRVLALLEQTADLAQQEPVARNAAGWQAANGRLVFARQLFNAAAQPYNDAVAVFPTRLLLPLFSFGRAGTI